MRMSLVPRSVWALVLIVACTAAAAAQQVPENRAQIAYSFAPVVKRTAPAVVNVYSKRVISDQSASPFGGDPMFRYFFGDNRLFGRPRERVLNSLGSGVIVEPSGFIVTNNHVIKGGTDIRVSLSDRREFEAKVVLADERTDLAILKIDPGKEPLPVLPMGDSDALQVGDLVLAIGNPFGVGQTVTSGIVSALARTHVGATDYQFFIQTDAAINPGNSGGALVDMAGELVGINASIYTRSGGSNGIGFAIPVNMVKAVIKSARAGGKIVRPWLGGAFQDVTVDIAELLGFDRPQGVLIADLHPQSPLVAAGLKRGDVILSVDGKPVGDAQELEYRLATHAVGDVAKITYSRDHRTRKAGISADRGARGAGGRQDPGARAQSLCRARGGERLARRRRRARPATHRHGRGGGRDPPRLCRPGWFSQGRYPGGDQRRDGEGRKNPRSHPVASDRLVAVLGQSRRADDEHADRGLVVKIWRLVPEVEYRFGPDPAILTGAL